MIRRRSGRSDALYVERECGAEITLQMAFVEFVEQDRADAAEFRIVLQHAREDAFGDDFDARARRHFRFEADAITDGFADRFAALRGHEFRRRARSDATRFEHEDFLVAEPRRVEQRERHLRRLARAGRRFEDQSRMLGQRCRYARQHVADRKVSGCAQRK